MSNIEYCEPQQTWPEAAELPLSVMDDDGETAGIYGQDGRVHSEVVLVGPKGDGGRLVIPLRFESLSQGLRAGQILKDAFDAVREIQDEEPVYHCEHRKIRFTFLRRSVEKHGICEGCSADLGTIRLAEYRDLQARGLDDNAIAAQL